MKQYNPKRCEYCGKFFTPTSGNQKACQEHIAEYTRAQARERYKAKPKPEPKSSLDEIARKARAKGMSYGMYQAQKNMDIARVQI